MHSRARARSPHSTAARVSRALGSAKVEVSCLHTRGPDAGPPLGRPETSRRGGPDPDLEKVVIELRIPVGLKNPFCKVCCTLGCAQIR